MNLDFWEKEILSRSIQFLPLNQAGVDHFIEDAENNDKAERRWTVKPVDLNFILFFVVPQQYWSCESGLDSD